MISRLRLRNFQSHRDTLLNLHPGVNAIVGASDSGKSALLRGADWVLTNRPAGEEFRSHWGGDTSVTLAPDGGPPVVRERTDKTNCYRVGDLMLKAMGADVPDEVHSALGIEDLNVQRQMDAHFLLSDSPGEVARRLNEVANLQSIDEATSRAASLARTAREELGRLRTAEAELTAQLEPFQDLEEREAAVARLERMDERYQAETARAATLTDLLDQARDADATLTQLADLPDRETAVKAAEGLLAGVVTARDRVRLLCGLVDAAGDAEAERDRAGALMKAADRIQRLTEAEAAGKGQRDRAGLVQDLINDAQRLERAVAIAIQRETDLQQALAAAVPETCPTCGQPWPEEET